MSVGRQLKEKREEKNWSQQDLADQIGVRLEDINDWEDGLRYPDIKETNYLCQLLNLSVNDLTNEDEVFKELLLDEQVGGQVDKVMGVLAFIIFVIVLGFGVYKAITLGLRSDVIMIIVAGLLGSFHFGKEIYRGIKSEEYQ